MKKDQWAWVRVFMSIHRSLLGSIKPNLRGVTYRWEYHNIVVDCYFDGEISEEDKELMSIANAEVYADFPEGWIIEFNCIRVDGPQKIFPEEKHNWIYLRYENEL